jgi:phytoene desaturase
MNRVVVVGAGLGGLSAAIHLALQGRRVTVLEQNGEPGGKMSTWSEGGYSFDTGPTLLTMPFILREIFAAAGRKMEDVLSLEPVDPVCRYTFADGSVFNAWRDPAALDAEVERLSPQDVEGVRRLLDHGERIYRASEGPFLRTPFGSWSRDLLRTGLRFLPSVRHLDAFRTLHAAVSSFVRDERLRQLFNRFATYNGSSPYRAPATLAIIPYVEMRLGGWTVRGGMYGIARALAALATDLGVELRYGTPVRRVVTGGGRARGVLCADGREVTADAVVMNADAVYAEQELLPGRRTPRLPEPSLSGFVLLLGVEGRYDRLAHHNIFFSQDYRREFAYLVDRAVPAQDPTIYVSVPPAGDSARAPAGHSALFVLVNAPALPAGWRPGVAGIPTPWDEGGEAYADAVIAGLERRGLDGLAARTRVRRVVTPLEFGRRFNAYRGSIYGAASNSRMAAFLRTPNVSRSVRGLYFAGGSTHPGGGIPLVLLSGRLAADCVLAGGGS